jgi:hypothetical protein
MPSRLSPGTGNALREDHQEYRRLNRRRAGLATPGRWPAVEEPDPSEILWCSNRQRAPIPRMDRQKGAGEISQNLYRYFAGVGRRCKIDKKVHGGVDCERMHGMIAGERKA